MLTEKQKTSLLSFNKKQSRLVRRFEELAGRLEKAGVTIIVDEENNDVYYANTRPLLDGQISSFENIAGNNPDVPAEDIQEVGYLPCANLPLLSLIYGGRFYTIFRKGSVRRILKKEE